MINKVIWFNKSKGLFFRKARVGIVGDILYLYLDDVNQLERIYTKYGLEPESILVVEVHFLGDRNCLFRYILKELDILLKKEGDFRIVSSYSSNHGCFIRSKSQIQNEFSLSTDGRYQLTTSYNSHSVLSLTYKKLKNTLKVVDAIDKWSFGIITNGKKQEQVENLVRSIQNLNIPNYEVLICGTFLITSEHMESVVVIDDVITDDLRAPISVKKNKIASLAKFENLILLHDRYVFPLDWYENMLVYGNYYELLIIKNIGPSGGRVNDWSSFYGMPSQIKGLSRLLPYSSWNEEWFSQGGIVVIKRSIYNRLSIDERLFWGELEDVQFSKKAQLEGYFCYLDINNSIFTYSDRILESRLYEKIWTLKFKQFVRGFLVYSKNLSTYYKNFFRQ
ncbi:hypothetical protein [Thalassolituus sp.]|uniref:hypothetical protein n=1 Tax=Thalassolituus sp. TaxID=2030822 RepID=UPI002A837F10|nr:hypothetical protein [Thalassolituus sp.]